MHRADGPRMPRRPTLPWRRLLFAALGLAAVAVVGCGPAGTAPLAEAPKTTPPTAGQPAPDPFLPISRPAADKSHPDEVPSAEEYARVVDNPFLAADRTPLSTFAVSVDTASYSNVRRFLLDDRRAPPPAAVRVAELVNYFSYSYPQPTGADPVSITADLADCPWDAAHLLVRIGVQARKTDAADLPLRNFVFLVDTSGSMNDPKRLPLFQQGLRLLVKQLTARDRVAIVTYAGAAGLALPSTPGDQKAAILRVIDGLSAQGSTNGSAGIQAAYQIAEANFIPGGANRVILGTDGDFNVGVTGAALVRLVEEKRKGGVFLTVLGFGKGNLKDAEMEELSYRGNGHYAYIDGPAELNKVFVEQGGALEAVAKDVKLQVEFNPQRVAGYRLIGYENRLLRDQDFNDDAKQGGAMGAGHTVTALYEVVPAGLPLPAPGVDPLKYQKPPQPSVAADYGEWLTVKMRYKDPESEASKELVRPLSGPAKMLSEAPVDFRFAAAVASFGQLLRDSEYKGAATYAAVRGLAKDALGADADGRRAEFLRMIDAAERLAPRKAGDDGRP